MTKIGYQGVRGAYSEKAIHEIMDTENIPSVGFTSFEKVYQNVLNLNCEYGLVPIENSLGGSIHENFDLLMRYNLHIKAEIDFRVKHCLLGLKNGGKITKVISHPQALAQCDEYVRKNHLEAIAEYDTAGSAELVQNNKMENTAAIASDLAAKYYDLEILDANIEDDKENYTRFILLGREPLEGSVLKSTRSAKFKTSIVFAFETHETGQLYKALSAFSLRDINLVKIESRPGKLAKIPSKKEAKYQYLFYIDFEGHTEDVKVKNALNHLHEFCALVKVFGSYPTKGVLLGDVKQFKAGLKNERNTVKELRLKIGIVGFGNFGQFLANTFVRYHDVVATSRTDYSTIAEDMNVTFVPMFDLDAFFAHKLDVIVLAMSITSFEKIVTSAIIPALKKSKVEKLLIVDVLSVKKHPKCVLLQHCIPSLDILCTHPMFGPESGKYSWNNLPMVYDKVRISRQYVCDRFLSIFRKENCKMIEMSCEKHDQDAASSQFITHFTGRILGQLKLKHSPIDTTGFTSLLELVDNTCQDSYDLFYGLYQYNQNSIAQITNFQNSIEILTRRLSLMNPKNQHYAINQLIQNIAPSKTIQIHALTKQLEAQGNQIVSLCVGEPDFQPHAAILDATKEAVVQGATKYTAVGGSTELKRSIQTYLENEKHVKYDLNQILVSNGGKQAIYQAILTVCSPSDEVVVPSPYWVSYPEIVRLAHATPVIVETNVQDEYLLSVKHLENAITSNTRLLVLCNPSNPTGATHSKGQLEAIAAVLRKPSNQHILVLSDEIYEKLTYEVEHVCFAALPGMHSRTLLINGFSKGFAMTGYRLGYLAGPSEIVQKCTILQGQITSCASSISQRAGVAALSLSDDDFKAYNAEIIANMVEKRNFAHEKVSSIPHVLCPRPTGAFYLFPNVKYYFGKVTPSGTVIQNSEDLCVYLIEEFKVAVVPGSAFGDDNSIRIAYATSMENLETGLLSISKGLLLLASP